MIDGFTHLPTEVQLAVLGILASLVGIISMVVRGRFVRSPEREREYRRPPLEVRLSQADRELVERHGDQIEKHATQLALHREEMIRQAAQPRPRRAPRTRRPGA